ncbi:hypothetical protein [uncultured Microscilla sp.]
MIFDADTSLELFENQEYTQVKTHLQASIQQMQYLLNNIGLPGELKNK